MPRTNVCVAIILAIICGMAFINHLQDGMIREYLPPPRFLFKDITPQACKGKVVVVTGANTGLGLSTAKYLAQAGATVVMTARSLERGAEALDLVNKAAGHGGKAVLRVLQLDDHHSIKKFATEFLSEFHGKLDVLVLNAGVMITPFGLQTKEGFELQIGTNHIGHFFLTKLLQPALVQSAPSRVVGVTSGGHMLWMQDDMVFDEFRLSHPANQARKDLMWSARFYGRSKLANILHMKELSRRLNKPGEKISVHCLSIHPGTVKTDLARYLLPEVQATDGAVMRTIKTSVGAIVLTVLAGMSPEYGALTQLWAAISPEVQEKQITAEYVVPIARVTQPSAWAKNETLARGLWQASEKFVEGW